MAYSTSVGSCLRCYQQERSDNELEMKPCVLAVMEGRGLGKWSARQGDTASWF